MPPWLFPIHLLPLLSRKGGSIMEVVLQAAGMIINGQAICSSEVWTDERLRHFEIRTSLNKSLPVEAWKGFSFHRKHFRRDKNKFEQITPSGSLEGVQVLTSTSVYEDVSVDEAKNKELEALEEV